MGFWLRRARWLLRAMYMLFVVTLGFAVVFLPSEVARLLDDALATFGYMTNWYLILGTQSCFETTWQAALKSLTGARGWCSTWSTRVSASTPMPSLAGHASGGTCSA